ncbi:hypothetical protein BT69DRAFT_1394919 [Atractiella rhizophila]|nr:hypothetical protein BT69DRAFT_1394919 [Atractiella rhizophila]
MLSKSSRYLRELHIAVVAQDTGEGTIQTSVIPILQSLMALKILRLLDYYNGFGEEADLWDGVGTLTNLEELSLENTPGTTNTFAGDLCLSQLRKLRHLKKLLFSGVYFETPSISSHDLPELHLLYLLDSWASENLLANLLSISSLQHVGLDFDGTRTGPSPQKSDLAILNTIPLTLEHLFIVGGARASRHIDAWSQLFNDHLTSRISRFNQLKRLDVASGFPDKHFYAALPGTIRHLCLSTGALLDPQDAALLTIWQMIEDGPVPLLRQLSISLSMSAYHLLKMGTCGACHVEDWVTPIVDMS